MKNPSEQGDNCFGKTVCGLILSNKLNSRQHRIISTFISSSLGDLNQMKGLRNYDRLRCIYLLGRLQQLEKIVVEQNLDEDCRKRIRYIVRFQSRPTRK